MNEWRKIAKNFILCFLLIVLFLLIILCIIAILPDVDLIDKQKNFIIHVTKIYAVSITILTIVLICVGWLQLENLNNTSKADFLFRIDSRYSSPEIIKARTIIQELYRKTTPPGQPYLEEQVTQKISDEIKQIGKESSKEACEKFIYLLNLLDFLETIAYFSNKGFVPAQEIDNLLGNTILFNYKIFKNWIDYRRKKYGKNRYYCEFESLVNKINSSPVKEK